MWGVVFTACVLFYALLTLVRPKSSLRVHMLPRLSAVMAAFAKLSLHISTGLRVSQA
jgi:hypothetical protein